VVAASGHITVYCLTFEVFGFLISFGSFLLVTAFHRDEDALK
jgi:hypothetical protein